MRTDVRKQRNQTPPRRKAQRHPLEAWTIDRRRSGEYEEESTQRRRHIP